MRYAGVALGLAVLVPTSVGCKRTQPTPGNESPTPADPPKAPAPAPALPEWDSVVVHGVPFYLAPIPRPAPGPAPTAAEVLATLFQSMADDSETCALLGRVHGGAQEIGRASCRERVCMLV